MPGDVVRGPSFRLPPPRGGVPVPQRAGWAVITRTGPRSVARGQRVGRDVLQGHAALHQPARRGRRSGPESGKWRRRLRGPDTRRGLGESGGRRDFSSARARLRGQKVVANCLKLFFPTQAVGETGSVLYGSCAQKTADLWEGRRGGCGGIAHMSTAIMAANMKCCCVVAGGQPGRSLPWTVREKIQRCFSSVVCTKPGTSSHSCLPGVCCVLGCFATVSSPRLHLCLQPALMMKRLFLHVYRQAGTLQAKGRPTQVTW